MSLSSEGLNKSGYSLNTEELDAKLQKNLAALQKLHQVLHPD